jgi:hypothetical protein
MSLSCVSGSCACEQLSDGVGDRPSLVVQTPMGDAHHPVLGELEGGVADAVALERGAGAVEGVAVELDYEFPFAPEGVDFEALCFDVDGGAREGRRPRRSRGSGVPARSGSWAARAAR